MDEKIVKDSQGLAKELVNGVKEFEELKVIDLNGRPYYSIIYLENGNEFEGYASYNLKVISEYLKRHFGFAQPETHDKRTEKHACDLIDRQAAIDDLHGKDPSQIWDTADVEVWVNALPSAQPEPLTGKEKMIFLAAMAKEENICKQIDDEYRDCELYEDSLVRACQEIERKVRGALWT